MKHEKTFVRIQYLSDPTTTQQATVEDTTLSDITTAADETTTPAEG